MSYAKSACVCGAIPGSPNRDCERCQLVAKIERLQAIVDTLPKTADGVPIHPGMTLFDKDGFSDTKVTGFQVSVSGELLCLYSPNGFDAICSGYYSTREAAEKASET